MRKIVCLATSPWYPIPTRKQQVMSRIPDAEILYFDPSVTYLAPLKDKAARPGLSNYKKEGVHPQENITVCAGAAVLLQIPLDQQAQPAPHGAVRAPEDAGAWLY